MGDPPEGRGFTDEPATRKMHTEFSRAEIADRHVLTDEVDDPNATVAAVLVRLDAGDLVYRVNPPN